MKKNAPVKKLSAYLHYQESHIMGLIEEEGKVIKWKDKEEVEALKQDILEKKVENAIVDVRGHIRLIQPAYQAYVLNEAEQEEHDKKATTKALHDLLGISYLEYPEKFYQYTENAENTCCSLTKEARNWLQSQNNPVVPMPMLHYNGEEVKSYRGLFQNLKLKNSLDISSVNSHYVTDMKSMFAGCVKADQPTMRSRNFRNLPNEMDEWMKCSFFLLGFEHLSTTRLENAREMFKNSQIRILDLRDFEVCSMKSVREFWEYAFFGELIGEEVFKGRIQTEDILKDFPLEFFDMGKYI